MPDLIVCVIPVDAELGVVPIDIIAARRESTLDKRVTRGNDHVFELMVREPFVDNDIPPNMADLTGCMITMTAKARRDDGAPVSADTPAFRYTSDDTIDITISDQVNTPGKALVFLHERDVRFLAEGMYLYDIRVRTPSGLLFTVAKGQLVIEGDVTSAEDLTTP
jgi:hypothetical protein